MRLFLIKLLFRILSRQKRWNIDVKEKLVNTFLSSSYQHQGMHDYIHVRDMNLLQQMGEGIEGKQYWITVGRRMELNYLLSQSKQAFERSKNKKGK